ncbi:hypothetical protein VaNZ11_009265 [Volvox africanus]|uniref:Helicase C-terminal domain-containing protein n=1 Tax=Volvox africanus TaxID=51714 RepID=A0ABQ5S8K1_9CHLO|nr:hypothetical protein VaNZ11_009265 [Volvox africanus]
MTIQISATAHPTAASFCDDWAAALSALIAAEILPDAPPVSTLRAALPKNLNPQTAQPFHDFFAMDNDSANILLPLTCNSIYDDRGIRIPVVAAAEPESAVSPNFSSLHDAVSRCVSEHPAIPRYLRPLSVLLIAAEAVRHLVRRPVGNTDGRMEATVLQHGPLCEAPSVAERLPCVRQQQHLMDFSETETTKRSHASLSTSEGDHEATIATSNNPGAAADNLDDDDDDSLSYVHVHKRRRVDEQHKVPCCGNAVGHVVVAAAPGPTKGEVVPEPTLVQCHAEMRWQDAELAAYLREFTEVVALELGDHMSGITVEGKEANEALSYLQRNLDAHLAMLLAGASDEAGTAADPTTLTGTAATVTPTTNLSSAAHVDSLRLLTQWLSKAREFAVKYPCPNLELTARLMDALVTAIDLVEDMGFEAALPYLARHAVVLCRDDLKIHGDPMRVDVTPAEGPSSSLPASLQEICRTFTAAALTTSTTTIPATSSTFTSTPMGQQPAIRYGLAPRPLGLLVRWKLSNVQGPTQRTVQLGLGPMGPSCPYPWWNPMAPTRGSDLAAGEVVAALTSCTDIPTRVSKLLKDLIVPDEGCDFLYSIFRHQHPPHHHHQHHHQQPQPPLGRSSDSDRDPAAAAVVEAAVRTCFSSWDDAGSSGAYTCPTFWTLVSYLQRYRHKPSFHGIVFVRTRQAAVLLADRVQRTRELQFLREPGRKVLVATSAAEEGLDVASCEFVVRYNAHVCGIGQRLVRDGNGWRIYSAAGRRLLRGVVEVCDIVVSGSGAAA